MADEQTPVRIEQIDWRSALPFVRLFGAFRMAIGPSKLTLALLLVVLAYIIGRGMDGIWGKSVGPNEIEQYITRSSNAAFGESLDGQQQDVKLQLAEQLARWQIIVDGLVDNEDESLSSAIIRSQRAADVAFALLLTELEARQWEGPEMEAARGQLASDRRQAMAAIERLEPRGIFDTTLRFSMGAFERLIRSAVELRHGFGQFAQGEITDRNTVVGAVYDLVVTLPGWLFRAHCVFLIVLVAVGVILWSVFGGAVCRMTALHATRNETCEVWQTPVALRFAIAKARWVSFALAPMIPLALALLCAVVLMAGGWLFNWPVLDVLGGLSFLIALVLSALIALALIAIVSSGHLLFPAIAVDGCDAGDAIIRSLGYVFGQPWRWAFLTAVSLVYGAITYLFVGFFLYLTLLIAHKFAGAWVVTEAQPGINRFDAIMPAPIVGNLRYDPQWSELGASGKIAAALVSVWVYLTVGLLAAYAISFYFSAQTWIYLLLRHSADGVGFDELYVEPDEIDNAETFPEKVEPPVTPDTSAPTPG